MAHEAVEGGSMQLGDLLRSTGRICRDEVAVVYSGVGKMLRRAVRDEDRPRAGHRVSGV